MVGPLHLLWASLSAALVTALATWLLAEWLRRNEERRRERRAFAEAVLLSCGVLDDIVVRYWGSDRNASNRGEMEILEVKLVTELNRIIGLAAMSARRRLTRDEKNSLDAILNRIYDEMVGDFESVDGAANAEKAGALLAGITRIRFEVNAMRAG